MRNPRPGLQGATPIRGAKQCSQHSCRPSGRGVCEVSARLRCTGAAQICDNGRGQGSLPSFELCLWSPDLSKTTTAQAVKPIQLASKANPVRAAGMPLVRASKATTHRWYGLIPWTACRASQPLTGAIQAALRERSAGKRASSVQRGREREGDLLKSPAAVWVQANVRQARAALRLA